MNIISALGKELKIDILNITDIIQCTGNELDFKDIDLPVDSKIYRYCILVVEAAVG